VLVVGMVSLSSVAHTEVASELKVTEIRGIPSGFITAKETRVKRPPIQPSMTSGTATRVKRPPIQPLVF